MTVDDDTREVLRCFAAALRAEGMGYRDIGTYCGVTHNTAYRWLNPGFEAKHRRRRLNTIRERRKRRYNDDLVFRKKENARSAKRVIRKRKAAPQYRLVHNLRERIRGVLRGKHKSGSAVRDLGCTVAECKAHLESLFKPGMSWDNYGEWQIDHIRPLASFDLTDREQFLRACHWTNLQPLWAADNNAKGATFKC